MSDFTANTALLLLLLIVFSPLLALAIYFLSQAGEDARDYLHAHFRAFKNRNELNSFFQANLHYYTLLNPHERKVFVRRVCYVLIKKKFQAKHQANINQSVLLLFAGSLVKLTFGLHDFHLAWHGEIIFFPNLFEYRQSGVPLKGLTYSKGKIVFSLPHFLEGIKNPFDKLNLALHEMAHALKVSELGYHINKFHEAEYVSIDCYPDSFLERFCYWHNIAVDTFKQQHSNDSFFRSYAYANIDEFWAVCVECFFESPEEFEQLHSALYYATAQVLNQDLASRWRNANATN